MDTLILAPTLNWIGKLIYENLYGWIRNWNVDFSVIGAFALTVIMFTLFLKLITLPLDVWQKVLGRKNSRKMEEMKPELDVLNKKYASDRNLLMQKQREVYKKYKYSAFSACLPSLVTLAIFITVFTGFNKAVTFHNYTVYEDLKNVYNQTYETTLADIKAGDEATDAEISQAIKAAENAVADSYKPESFLVTTNIFMPDTYVSPIPTIKTFSGTGMGKLGITDVDPNQYEDVMKPLFEKYNVNESNKKVWNGYFILPILSFALSILSTKLIKPPEQPQMAGQTEEQLKAQKQQAKMMAYMMPVMMGVFALFYSTAFTLYMVVGNIFSTLFNLIYNLIAKQVDAKRKDQMMSITVKK